jgi:hypothetical protein
VSDPLLLSAALAVGSLLVGVAVGVLSCSAKSGRSSVLSLVLFALLLGAGVAALLSGRLAPKEAASVEAALALTVIYLVGCAVGCTLRALATRGRAKAA